MRAIVTIQFQLAVSGESNAELERKALEAARLYPEEVAAAVAKSAQIISIES